MQDVVPTPVVAKAEADSRIGAACARMAKDAIQAHAHGIRGDLARIEIARRLCALARDPHAQQEAKEKEAKRRTLPGYVGGRPYTVHGIAFSTLSAQTGLNERTVERWFRQWNMVAEALDIKRDEAAGVFILDEPVEGYVRTLRDNPPIETWLENVLHPKEEQKASPVEPKQIIVKAANTIQKLFSGRIPSKSELESLAESLNAALSLSANSSLPLYVARGEKAKAMHQTGAKSPFRKE